LFKNILLAGGGPQQQAAGQTQHFQIKKFHIGRELKA
jgi:hypothetical protein